MESLFRCSILSKKVKVKAMEKKKQWIINAIFYLIIGGSFYVAVTYLLPVFMPFLIAFLFAAFIHKVVGRISTKTEKRKKWLSICLTTSFYLLIVLVLCVLGGWLIHLVEKAFMTLPKLYEEQFVPWVYSIANRLEQRYGGGNLVGFDNIGNSFIEFVSSLGESLSEMATDGIKDVSGYAAKIPSFLMKIVLMVIATFFIAADYEKIIGFLMKLLPRNGQLFVLAVKRHVLEVFTAYMKSYSILMLLTFVELCIGLAILKIPYFFVISIGIALFDILPVLGTGGVLIPWAAASVIIGNYELAIGLILLNLVISIIRNTLEPRIVGKQIGVHPLATLIAMFVGLKLCGFVGMIGFPMCLSIVVQVGKEEFSK